jgi:hypothetical protein
MRIPCYYKYNYTDKELKEGWILGFVSTSDGPEAIIETPAGYVRSAKLVYVELKKQ